ncbi:Phosphoglucomutase/phosphomannomutase [uncultured archaeon]|nr:Phosphoglucomutase/phosphomannomutase [uncultured archaeon]
MEHEQKTPAHANSQGGHGSGQAGHHRKLFGTDGIRGKANHYPMTPELCLRLGKAIALHFEKKGFAPKVLIGKDTRISGYMLETALTSGLVSMGAEVFLVGPMPTPGVSFLGRSQKADAGIVISASHNPAEDNGIKIFDSRGCKLSDADEASIESIMFSAAMENGAHEGRPIGKAFRVEDAHQRYRDFVKSSMNGVRLNGLRVVVDCANGAAYRIAPQVFLELGLEVIIIGNQPDGFNINRDCGATSLAAVSARVMAEKADIGIALDGDADRVIIIDEKGLEVNGDKIMACLGIDLMEKGRLAKNIVVSTVMSNAALEDFLSAKGISVVRAKVGDRYVIDEMLRGGFNFGGEQSGHIIYGEYSTTGDGMITALQFMRIMIEKGKSVSGLVEGFGLYPQVLLNVRVRQKKPFDELPFVRSCISDAERELAGKGRVLVRYSGTENICRIMAEGPDESMINKLANSIAEKIRGEIGE